MQSSLVAQPHARACRYSEGTRCSSINPADREEPTRAKSSSGTPKVPSPREGQELAPGWQALHAASQPALSHPSTSAKATPAGAEVDSGDGETLQNHFLLKCLQPVGCMLSAMGDSDQVSFAASAFRDDISQVFCQKNRVLPPQPPPLPGSSSPSPAAPQPIFSARAISEAGTRY